MKTIKGPAIFLAQFMDDKKPFNNMENICKWVSKLGYKGVQIPTWDPRCIDLEKVAKSKDFADEYKAKINSSRVFKLLAKAGILVRKMDVYGIKNSLRITIGKSKENRKLIFKMKRILNV